MSNIAKLREKFGHRFTAVKADDAIAQATSGGASKVFYRIKGSPGSKGTVRFLPGVATNGPSDKVPYIVSYKQHFVPGANGRSRSIVCPSTFNLRCPICALHDEAMETIAVEGKGKGDKPGRKEYKLQGDQFENGMAARTLFLTQVMVLEAGTYGGTEWSGPRPMEMSTVLVEKIFGLPWKEDTFKSRLTSQCAAEISDPIEGYAVSISGAAAPHFYTVDPERDRSGAIVSKPLWSDPDDPRWEEMFEKMVDLQTLIVRPPQEVLDFAVDALRAKLDEAVLAMHGGPRVIDGEAEDATTIVASRKPARAAAPALEAPAPEVTATRRRAPVADAEPAAPPARARAAATSFDFTEDESL